MAFIKLPPQKRIAQSGIEYLVLFGFVSFFVLVIVGLAYSYISKNDDGIKMAQIQQVGNKLVSGAESVYYAGAPSRLTMEVYFPQGVEGVTIMHNEIVFNVSTSSGLNIIGFSSKVPLNGTLSTSSGIHLVEVVASTTNATLRG